MVFVYSCCFWFSLRLGGILIGVFSFIQAFLILFFCSWALNDSQRVKDEIMFRINSNDLVYTQYYVDNFLADPEKYLTVTIILVCVYMVSCVLYIYGAYTVKNLPDKERNLIETCEFLDNIVVHFAITFNNMAMGAFILMELMRLLLLFTLVVTWLLVLKHNTMDIGLVIGASVGCGFLLLGMFYLWVCAANLPLLINEMERENQEATIARLQRLLEASNTKSRTDHFPDDFEDFKRPFVVSSTRTSGYNNPLIKPSKHPVRFYTKPFR